MQNFSLKKIPILIEKPLSSDVKSALEIVIYAKKQNTPVLTGHLEHNKIIQSKKQKQSGDLGKIIACHAALAIQTKQLF